MIPQGARQLKHRCEQLSRRRPQPVVGCAGQAAIEMVMIMMLGTTLLGSLLIFYRLAAEDEELLADSRWIAFQCAYHSTRCADPVEPHGEGSTRAGAQSGAGDSSLVANTGPLISFSASGTAGNSIDRKRSVHLEPLDSGPSLLARQSLSNWSLEAPDTVARRFGLDAHAGLASGSSGLERSATGTEISFGLPHSMLFGVRRLSTLRDPWSQDPLADHEQHTLNAVREAIAIPAQTAVYPVLTVTQAMQRALAFLGLEPYEAQWAERPVRTLRATSPQVACPQCVPLSPRE